MEGKKKSIDNAKVNRILTNEAVGIFQPKRKEKIKITRILLAYPYYLAVVLSFQGVGPLEGRPCLHVVPMGVVHASLEKERKKEMDNWKKTIKY